MKIQRNEECDLCGLGDTTEHVCVMGNGPKNAKIMVIGEAPGASEERTGKPFQGRAGQLLDKLLADNGINRDDVYVTNVVHCRPPENRTPSNQEMKACKPYLDMEISAVNPEYILCLGATAYKAIFNKSGIMEARGSLLEKDGRKYFLTIHPAAALRQPRMAPYLETDIHKFAEVTRGMVPSEDNIEWTYVDNMEKLRNCFSDLFKSVELVYDFETHTTDPVNGYIYCLGIATEHHNWSIPFNYMDSTWPMESEPKMMKIFKKIFADKNAEPKKKIVAHGGKFDGKWFETKGGFRVRLTFDTMLAAHLLDENRLVGLKPLAKIYFNASNYEISFPIAELKGVSQEQIRTFEAKSKKTPDIKTLCKYNAYDCHYTRLCYHKFKKELKEDNKILTIFKKWTMPASNVLQRIELGGVYVDFEKYQGVMEELNTKTDELLNKLNEISENKVENWNSTQQVAKYLFDYLKLPILETTASGAPSTSGESVLPRLVDKHPVIQALLDYRENIKLQQFIASWGESMDKDHYMHPTFKIHGTVTGRLSCVEPNLQQVPRDPLLRSLITAPEGWTLVEADYSQAELRVASMMANEPTMKMAYQAGQDIHLKTAAAIMGVPPEKVSKADRKKAKAVNFGFLYGMSAGKFKDYARDKYQVNLTDKEARDFRARFFELYPVLLNWHERQRQLARKFKYVRSPIGRKRRLPEVDSPDKKLSSEAERQAINSPVQGTASDLCMFSMIRLCKEFKPDVFRPIGLVHDATLSMVRNDRLYEIAGRIKEVMQDMDTVEKVFGCRITVPIVADVKIGPWGKGKDWPGEEA
jgi:DNA polymerase-1